MPSRARRPPHRCRRRATSSNIACTVGRGRPRPRAFGAIPSSGRFNAVSSAAAARRFPRRQLFARPRGRLHPLDAARRGRRLRPSRSRRGLRGFGFRPGRNPDFLLYGVIFWLVLTAMACSRKLREPGLGATATSSRWRVGRFGFRPGTLLAGRDLLAGCFEFGASEHFSSAPRALGGKPALCGGVRPRRAFGER